MSDSAESIPQHVEDRIVARATRESTLIWFKAVASTGATLFAALSVVLLWTSWWPLAAVLLPGAVFGGYAYLNAESVLPEVAA